MACACNACSVSIRNEKKIPKSLQASSLRAKKNNSVKKSDYQMKGAITLGPHVLANRTKLETTAPKSPYWLSVEIVLYRNRPWFWSQHDRLFKPLSPLSPPPTSFSLVFSVHTLIFSVLIGVQFTVKPSPQILLDNVCACCFTVWGCRFSVLTFITLTDKH